MAAPIRQILRKHFASRQHAAHACLVVSSTPSASHDDNVHYIVEQTQACLSYELNLRTVPSTLSSSYPTLHDVTQALDLARRAGCRTVVGVGGGNAMDLAKSTASMLASNQNEDDAASSVGVDLILAPGTLGGVMACSSETSLVYVPEEGVLLPLHLATKNDKLIESSLLKTMALDEEAISVVLPDDQTVKSRSREEFSALSIVDVAMASLAICLDIDRSVAISRGANDSAKNRKQMQQILEQCVDHAITSLNYVHQVQASHQDGSHQADDAVPEKEEEEKCKYNAIQAALLSGSLLRYSRISSENPISTPAAMACALLPTFFPHAHFVTYMASTFPALHTFFMDQQLLQSSLPTESNSNFQFPAKLFEEDPLASTMSPSMATFAEGAPSADTMLDQLYATLAVLDRGGMQHDPQQMARLEHILKYSLNR